MSRRLKNWLETYIDYATDNYCPPEFHKWVGLSVLAGALERKVWTLNGKIYFYPNMFVMLVTYPGVGKSTALNRGTDLLERLKQEVNPEFKIISQKSTDASFVKSMAIRQVMEIQGRQVFHSSGYFYASEASASALQNTHGDFIASITDFYDCPRVSREATISRGENEMYNVCFNMLSGATFEYLSKLVNDVSVMGGFASRIIYVINKERLIRKPKWGESLTDADDPRVEDLFQDLIKIHQLVGKFRPSADFIKAWEKFQPESDRALAEMNSPRLESLAARKPVNMMKVAMLLSVAESDNLNLEVHHWEQARTMIEEVSKDNAFILSQGAIANKQSQIGATQVIGQTLHRAGGKMNRRTLKGLMLQSGHNVEMLTKTLDYMADSNLIQTDGESVILTSNPDRYL